jgi:hypothetical protein
LGAGSSGAAALGVVSTGSIFALGSETGAADLATEGAGIVAVGVVDAGIVAAGIDAAGGSANAGAGAGSACRT